MEYKYLAHLTGRSQYYEAVSTNPFFAKPCLRYCSQVEKIMDIMRDADVKDGMFPTRWAVSNALPLNGAQPPRMNLTMPS